VGHLTVFNITNELLITILSLDEGYFVIPPLECFPIILTIFKELPKVIRVLAESTNDTLIWGLLVPFQTLEGK